MCSIMGYCSDGASLSLFKEGFDKTISRGPDDSRIVDTGRGLLGFHRLSIMGLEPSGMQPFELDGSYVVCNGEIYGFEKLKRELQEKGYSFQSESDCEVLLPLYREHGTEVLRRLIGHGVMKFLSLFKGSRSRSEIVATFLSVLELCRLHSVRIEDTDAEQEIAFVQKPDEKDLSWEE